MYVTSQKARPPNLRAFVVCVLILIACMPCLATEYGPINNEFRIRKDFATIVFSELEAKNARIFVDIERFVVPKTLTPENDDLRKIAIDDLSAKFRLVARKEDANYLVQIRMEEFVDYATRNPRGEPAQGFVMSSICKYPIIDIEADCGNTEYDYFHKGKKIEIFRRFFDMWIQALVMPPSK
jgi:hypothetical protein